MFQPIGSPEAMLTVYFDNLPVTALPGETVASCLLRNGVTRFRTTPVSGAARMPFCMIGHCFECLVEIEGLGSRQACLTVVREGMQVATQAGPATIYRGANYDR
ncbi:(2Fe-2S)-binding protein [Rhizobium sp. 11_C7_N12_5]|jgi:predicted molibdopterin-dependent oxidoreductase YjgC|uniref:(2Fe-2S)-binding protein n=1 Tax=Rhizobium sp. 11_C7_N12_5 TaxID=3240770 RepID=UPI003F28D5EC